MPKTEVIPATILPAPHKRLGGSALSAAAGSRPLLFEQVWSVSGLQGFSCQTKAEVRKLMSNSRASLRSPCSGDTVWTASLPVVYNGVVLVFPSPFGCGMFISCAVAAVEGCSAQC